MNELSDVRAAAFTAFLDGGGSCGQLIANRDWAATALGPIEQWPQSLKTATAILLRSPVPMVMLWGEDGIMLYNDAYSVIAGGRHPQVLGSKVREGWPEVADFNNNVMKTGLSGQTLAYRDQEFTLFRHGHPEQVWMNLDYSPVLDEYGRPAGVLAIVAETTKRKQADDALQLASERAHAEAVEREAILSQLGEGVIVTDSEGRITFVNDAAERLHGVKLLGVEPGRYAETYHLLTENGEPHPPLELPLARAVLRGETVVEARWRIRRPDGTEVLATGNAKPITDADGKRIGGVLTIRDETERHAAEAALAESEERLRLATEAAEIGFWDLDPTQDELFWPPRVKAMFGISPNVPVSMSDFYSGLHPDDRKHVGAEFARAVDPEVRGLYDVEYRAIGKEDGLVRWVAAKGQAIFDTDGECVRVLGTAIDITTRKRVEQHQRLLIDELSHRAKNLLAIVQGVAQQSFKGERSRDQMMAAFEGRLGALSAAHNILTRERWESVPLRQLIEDTLAAVGPVDERIRLEGADTLLPPKTGVSLAMAIHELATNALKYGSLSDDVGTVAVRWSTDHGRMHLEWREQGGPIVAPPTSRGFGTRMIERGLASEFGGTVVIDFAATGVVCTVDAPLPDVGE